MRPLVKLPSWPPCELCAQEAPPRLTWPGPFHLPLASFLEKNFKACALSDTSVPKNSAM